ncbi:AEC family transporter [Clostridium sp. AN503]|uniref:AEC family transporter n=1 Tax=Clostridium sp. AN503 TaxID=3160598 RepID=UPI00345A1594
MSGILTVLTKAIAFIFIIVMGYALKKKGFFAAKDFYLISRIVIRITLPCAIISNFSSLTMDNSLLFLCVIGILANLVMVGIGFLTNIRSDGDRTAFDMINLSGYNIGNFTLPFVQSFLGPVGFAATSLFDAGNAVMCTGVTYTLASLAKGTGEKASPSSVVRSLLSSLPFDAYVIMTILAVCKIPLPSVVISFASTVGGANAFLALLMIGIGFEIHMEKEKLNRIIRLMVIRYGVAVVFALGAFFLLPFPLPVRQAMTIVAFGPISSVATAFTGRIGGDVELSSAVNSLSIVLSIITITLTLILVL